jgi:ActR/RegA family two-component response regulator
MMMKKRQWQILVVDDDPTWLDLLEEILEDEGYGVCKAATYEEAVQSLERQTFQLAVVDVNLADAPVNERGEPMDTSGLAVIEQIGKRAPDTSVIIVTGYGTFNVARKALQELGVRKVIPKGELFDVKEFGSVVADAVAHAVKRMLGEAV